jgi:hypothetical protein
MRNKRQTSKPSFAPDMARNPEHVRQTLAVHREPQPIVMESPSKESGSRGVAIGGGGDFGGAEVQGLCWWGRRGAAAKADPPSQLLVMRANGTIEYEYTYEYDPYPPVG